MVLYNQWPLNVPISGFERGCIILYNLFTFSHDRIPKQDRTLYIILHYCILHHPILIKDQIFGSDGFHQHKICVNM